MKQDRFLEFNEVVQRHHFPPPNRKRTKPISKQIWTEEAEKVAANLRSFTTFINSIRRAYLDLSSTSNTLHQRPRIDLNQGLTAWEGVKALSDRERDEIDLEVKAGLRRATDRVRELEGAEKRRIANEARQNPTSSFARFLQFPTSAPPVFDAITSHRAHITLYLNTLLSHVSQLQIHQQETRIRRQLEKRATLGGLGGGNAIGMDRLGSQLAEQARLGKMLEGKGKGKEVGQVPDLFRPAPLPSGEESIDSILTPEQVQQFEQEASALLKSTQSDLQSLKAAESSLLEISALQSQLAIHLTQQSELTDKLWEEAVGVTGKVEDGNVQLKKARERNREGRVWLLIFLVGASASLLFLDYYT